MKKHPKNKGFDAAREHTTLTYMQILLDAFSFFSFFAISAFLCHRLYPAFAFDGFLLAFGQGSGKGAGLTASSLQQF